MRTDTECPVCLRPINDERPGIILRFLDGRTSPRHKWRHDRGRGETLVCVDCATVPNAGSDGKENLLRVAIQEFTDGRCRAECERCQVPMLVKPDKRRKHVYCSGRCRIRAWRDDKPVQPAVTLTCEGCGVEMTGRTDRKFCSPACRQKAYRDKPVQQA